MGRFTLLVALIGGLASPARLHADPLDCIPPSAQLVLVSDNPRALAEAVIGLEALQKAQTLPQYRPVYDSAATKRAFQLLAMFEKELGAKWPELLDQLAGNGAAIGVQIGTDPAPAILVLQGKDEEQVKKATDLAFQTIEDELTRQGAKDVVKRSEIGGHPAVTVGDLRAARVGATTIVSNNEKMLTAAVRYATTDRAKSPIHKGRRDAFTLLPKNPLAWVYLDFASVKQSKAAKDFFDATRQDFLQTLVVGGTIDCLKRADFIAAGLYQDTNGTKRIAVRLPAGRSEFPPEFQLHVPPKGEPGTLPLLEPPGTIYTHSLHLDISHLWLNRKTLLNDEIRGGLEKADKDVSKFLPGSARLGDLLAMWGPYHRIVVANHDTPPYKKQPGLRLPAFGYVATGRDPKFAKSVEPALRSAAIVASLQFGLKMTEHTHEGIAIVAYRFPEDKELADDAEGIRFNFEPCFAIVADQLVVASTVELCKKLITELKGAEKRPASSAVVRGKLSAKGGADFLAALPEPLITDAILNRGIGLEEARKEVAELVKWVKALGTFRGELDITEKQYKLDLVWEPKK